MDWQRGGQPMQPGMSQIMASRPPPGLYGYSSMDASGLPPDMFSPFDSSLYGLPPGMELSDFDPADAEVPVVQPPRTTPFIAPREGPLVPPSLLARLRSRPWSYTSLSRWLPDALDRINDDPVRAVDTTRLMGYTRADGTLTYDDWLLASERLLDALTHIDAAAFELFTNHFDLVRERYNELWWPALRRYDLDVRRAHTVRTTEDLQTFDVHRFANILLDLDAPTGSAPSTMSSVPSRRPAVIYGSQRRPAPAAHEIESSTRLDLLLESLKPGLGSTDIVNGLRGLGVDSPRHLADLAALGPDILDEVLHQPSALTTYQRVMLRELLGRRFATQPLHDRSSA